MLSNAKPVGTWTLAALVAGGLWLQGCGTREEPAGAQPPDGASSDAAQPRYGGRTWGVNPSPALTTTSCTDQTPTAVRIQATGFDRKDGTSIPLGAFSWIVERDTTLHHVPGTPAIPGQDLSVSFHASYAFPVANGERRLGDPDPIVMLPRCGWYFVSILPRQELNGSNGGYELTGAPVPPRSSSAEYTVRLRANRLPKPTGSLSVFAFEDNSPINNEPDLPQERGLAGFTVYLIEAGGTYGASGGLMTQDAFGNRLGTEYHTNADGTPRMENGVPIVKTPGKGYLVTDENGEAVFHNLSQAKYSVQMLAPPGTRWKQTSTIEGTRTIDAWIKAGEPSVFVEYGPPGHHVFVGFVDPAVLSMPPAGGASTTAVTGQVVNMHMSRPPDYAMHSGQPIEGAWVGLNAVTNGVGTGVYAAPADPATGRFRIPNVPPGQYQLVVWDENLDLIWAFHDFTVPANPPGSTDLTQVAVFKWFTQLEVVPFFDANGDGIRQADEPVMEDIGVVHRFRDGSIYAYGNSDPSGVAHNEELFPFFNWMAVEIDVTRHAITAASIWVDDGGPIDPNDPNTFGVLSPQWQATEPEFPADSPAGWFRLEPGAGVEAYQGFIGQTSHIEWGLANHGDGENGGVSGIVSYDTTRAEDDPQYGTQEEWQPGVPHVQLAIYPDDPANPGTILGTGPGGAPCLADVDNHPFGWARGIAPKGPEDVKRNTCAGGNGAAWSKGDAIDVTWSTSWDEQQPRHCQWPGGVPFSLNGVETDCFDGMRAFNQVRPGTYDGGWGFGTNNPRFAPQMPTNPSWPDPFVEALDAGAYVVEMIPPPSYQVVKEEDRNVVFGDTWEPQPLPAKLPFVCVGALHHVPDFLSLFPDGEFPSAFAGQDRPLCDMKRITINDGENAGANFFLFTEVPVAAHIQGMVLDDLTNEFDVLSPTFGEKYSPPHIPVAILDWSGHEITRVYSDEYGMFNALVPSTFNINPPYPSGVGPNILTACINSPGPIPDPANPGKTIVDPWFDRRYSQFCYELQYMPGKTTYLDTPVVPIAAFTGSMQPSLDCEHPDRTPMIHSVTPPGANPTVPGPLAAPGAQLRIVSRGLMDVPNPRYVPHYSETLSPPVLPTIQRDYGFGVSTGAQPGRVFLDMFDANGNRSTADTFELRVDSWTPDEILVSLRLPGAGAGTLPATVNFGELRVVRGDNGAESPVGVTVHLAGRTGQPTVASARVVRPGQSIQAAVDAAGNGEVIFVAPGTYEELVILDKPVRLQGAGAGSTVINAAKIPSEKVVAWRQAVRARVDANPQFLLAGQPNLPAAGEPSVEPALLATEEGPGILVLAGNFGNANSARRIQVPASVRAEGNGRIDGFFVTGGDSGGAIFVNGHAHGLRITNNEVTGNQGFYGGGIRLGHPTLTTLDAAGNETYVSADDASILLARNRVTRNGGIDGAGGGVSIHTGATDYRVVENYVCGNFTAGDGGGIGHLGLSNGGRIERNQVLFNQSFDQASARNGGGILVSGGAPLAAGGLSPGSGSVTINRNQIVGNLAGAGDGGGIRLQAVNGNEMICVPILGCLTSYRAIVSNNVLSGNVAGYAGGAISMQDVAGRGLAGTIDLGGWGSAIVNNTLDFNDSTASSGAAFPPGNQNQSQAQVAGIVSYPNSPALNARIQVGVAAVRPSTFSNPDLRNNVIRKSRSFFFTATSTAGNVPTFSEVLNGALGATDLGVVGGAGNLNPRRNVLTVPYPAGSNNTTADPQLVREAFNQPTSTLILTGGTVGLDFTLGAQVTPAFDEGGNFVDARFQPLTLFQYAPGGPGAVGSSLRDLHVAEGGSANQLGDGAVFTLYPETQVDIEGRARSLSGPLAARRMDAGAYTTPVQP